MSGSSTTGFTTTLFLAARSYGFGIGGVDPEPRPLSFRGVGRLLSVGRDGVKSRGRVFFGIGRTSCGPELVKAVTMTGRELLNVGVLGEETPSRGLEDPFAMGNTVVATGLGFIGKVTGRGDGKTCTGRGDAPRRGADLFTDGSVTAGAVGLLR
jgi:hypothetical protein